MNTTIALVMPSEMKRKLRNIATVHGLGMSSLIRLLISREIGANGKIANEHSSS